MAQTVAPKTFPGSLYFAYTGCVVGAVLLVTYLESLFKHSWDEVLTRVDIVLFAMTAVYGAAALAQRLRWFTWLRIALNAGPLDAKRPDGNLTAYYDWFVWIAGACFVLTSLTLLFDAHRRYIGVVGLLEASAVRSLRGPMPARAVIGIAVVSVTTWALTSGLTYTNFGDWVLNSNVAPLAVLGFVLAFGLVLIELSGEDQPNARPTPRYVLWAVAALFIAFAFRSDELLDSWIPYHRSFFVDAAQFVREGHWLLWDVPSLYGFLSVALIAAIPARDAWQGLFVLTSVLLVIQSVIIFTLWRWGRAGWTNLFFALLLTLATFGDSIARYPWSARLYPQGGLRFIWILALLVTTFLIYVWRENTARVRALYWAGHAIWLMSLFWSFETAVWETVMWLPYLTLSILVDGCSENLVSRFASRFWPLLVLPLVTVAAIHVVYVRALGHGPDWLGFVEFTGLFVSGTVHASFPTNPLGAGWCIVLVLGSVGSIGIAAIRRAQWAVIPLLAATWLAVWATSTYFSVEPFDGHVALLIAVLVPAAAIVTFVSREVLSGDRTALYARLSIAPLAILCISMFISRPTAFAGMKFPLEPGWTTDTVDMLPPISGELAHLIARAGVAPGGPLLIPTGPYWTEISQGLLFPVGYVRGGGRVEYRSWAPVSPIGMNDTIMGLSASRRQTYIERFLARSRSGGWYFQYRAPAICKLLSPHLVAVKTVRSANYSGSLCAFK